MGWRIIELDNLDVFSLHAMEDVLFEQAVDSDPTIVLSKVKPGISIASNQNFYLDIDSKSCLEDNVLVTRRRTGGRSMYLDHNYLILSVITNNSSNGMIDVHKQYRQTIDMITGALSKITGKEYHLMHQNDIVVDDRKIGGAAQRNAPKYNLVHCYIRVGNDLHKMLKYVKVDGHGLAQYYDELRRHITCINDIVDTRGFYEKFKNTLTQQLHYYDSKLTSQEQQAIDRKILTYTDLEYVRGKHDYPSKGNCDIIEGSGPNAKLKIFSLEGKVKFS